jgi:hypothetical protein
MAQKTPEQITSKFQAGIQAAGQAYAQGVQNPSRPWASATVAGQARWQAGIQQAIAQGSFARGVQKAGDAKWQQAASGKGARNFTAAAPDAAAAYAQKAQQIISAGQAARAAANAMPSDSQEARLQRAVASMRAISAYWKQSK